MKDRIRRYVRHYLYGLFARSWNGAWSATDAIIGLGVGAMITDTISFPTWQAAGAVFATTFVRNAVTYFAKNPLPEKIDLNTRPPFSP